MDTQTGLNVPVACCDEVLGFLEHLLSTLEVSFLLFNNYMHELLLHLIVEILCSISGVAVLEI